MNLCAKVKASLTIMWSTGTIAWCPCQHRIYRLRWEDNMSLFREV
jgi:hypothetical protein